MKQAISTILLLLVVSFAAAMGISSDDIKKENVYAVRGINLDSSHASNEFWPDLFYVSTDKTKNALIEETGAYDIYDVYTNGRDEYIETNELLITGTKNVRGMFRRLNLSDIISSIDSIRFSDEFIIYKVKCNVSDIRELCKRIEACGLCKAVKPNTIYKTYYPETANLSITTKKSNPDGNPYFSQQWALYNSANPILDIDAQEAWDLSTGSNIKVALLCDGIQLDHPDLADNLLSGYDLSKAPGIKDGSNSNDDPIGTRCAGIIAASDNNIGVIGIAPDAKIIPIKVTYYNSTTHAYANSDENLIYGIQKAIECEADIIEIPLYKTENDPILDEIFEYAYKYGRAGKGTIIICNTGVAENNHTVKYPGSSVKDVITVGGITKSGQRYYNSSYGESLDVVAPCESLMTTDVNSGYTFTTSLSRASSFGSSVAALMLSFNPYLTYREVQRIINSTATKLPGYTFTNSADHPDGTWNEEVGYGLINAFEAVKGTMSIEGADVLCDEEVYTLEGLPEGAEVRWSFGEGGIFYVFPPLEIIDGQGTAQATFKRGGEWQMQVDPDNPTIVKPGKFIPYVGTQTIRARVTMNGSSYTLEKEVTMEEIITPDIAGAAKVGTVAPPGTVLAMWMQGQAKTLTCTGVNYFTQAQVNNVRWTVTQPNGDMEYYSGTSITVTPNGMGRLTVTVTDGNQCHLANSCTAQYLIHGYAIGLNYSNPASGSVDISVVKQAGTAQDGSGGATVMSTASAQQAYEEPYMGEYRLELWHEVYGMVREMDVEAGNPTVTMDLGGLTPGWYYMRLIADGEMKAVGKLMVR